MCAINITVLNTHNNYSYFLKEVHWLFLGICRIRIFNGRFVCIYIFCHLDNSSFTSVKLATIERLMQHLKKMKIRILDVLL